MTITGQARTPSPAAVQRSCSGCHLRAAGEHLGCFHAVSLPVSTPLLERRRVRGCLSKIDFCFHFRLGTAPRFGVAAFYRVGSARLPTGRGDAGTLFASSARHAGPHLVGASHIFTKRVDRSMNAVRLEASRAPTRQESTRLIVKTLLGKFFSINQYCLHKPCVRPFTFQWVSPCILDGVFIFCQVTIGLMTDA